MRPSILFVVAMSICVVGTLGDDDWGLPQFVHGALSGVTGGGKDHNGSGRRGGGGGGGGDAMVCSQEVVCDSEGNTYPNPCIAREEGVTVVPCADDFRSGSLLGIPEALRDIGHGFLDVVVSPLSGGGGGGNGNRKKNNNGGGGGGGFNPLDPLQIFDDPFDDFFNGFEGRRLLRRRL
ncbi:hypothetical protein BSKO_03770 [Bryopsis sp. KO-2023]|nr:hypothetical protein BSKO_03770 [Bryopsis sp. KO-2023]